MLNKTLLRPAEEVMDIRRLGAMHQTRISFVRSFLRSASANHWHISVRDWCLNSDGYGYATYRLQTKNGQYHLIVHCDEIRDDERSDRVIAEKWDVVFALVDGDIDQDIISNLRKNLPFQERGRYTNKILVLSRANKSVRVFNHVIESLASGKQPDISLLSKVGYILRTTAVYGNGKFGVQDFGNLAKNEDFNLSFSVQMCAVYMLRHFSFDLIDFLAKQRGGKNAIKLRDDYKRYLGIGNATGLGMSLFLIQHPKIVDNWIYVREQALAQVMAEEITQEYVNTLVIILKRARLHLKQVYTINERQKLLNINASEEIESILEYINHTPIDAMQWQSFINENRSYSHEAQEVVISSILELYPNIVDTFCANMNADESDMSINGVKVRDLISLLTNKYQWATSIDFSEHENKHWFWYISENKEEPRLGVRGESHGDELELPLDIARQINSMYHTLMQSEPSITLIDFLIEHPQFSSTARRTWTLGNCYMGEIRGNVLAKDFLPMDLLRCKLSVFGATKFDPRSDRWVRVTFFQNAPLMNETDDGQCLFPIEPGITIDN